MRLSRILFKGLICLIQFYNVVDLDNKNVLFTLIVFFYVLSSFVGLVATCDVYFTS